MVLVTKQGNLSKEKAFERATTNIFPGIESVYLNMQHEYDVRPLKREGTKNAAVDNARRLCSQLRMSGYQNSSYAIAIQKGATISDEGPSRLIAVLAVESIDTKIQFSVSSDEEVELPAEARTLVGEGKEIYAVWEELFPEGIKKNLSVYQIITNCDETVWLQKLFEKGLQELKRQLQNTPR